MDNEMQSLFDENKVKTNGFFEFPSAFMGTYEVTAHVYNWQVVVKCENGICKAGETSQPSVF